MSVRGPERSDGLKRPVRQPLAERTRPVPGGSRNIGYRATRELGRDGATVIVGSRLPKVAPREGAELVRERDGEAAGYAPDDAIDIDGGFDR